MDLFNPQTIKQILRKYNVHPQKRYGQNFLIDEKVADTMIEAAQITNDDTVLEIGPGIGNLTNKLCQKAKNVVSVEIDKTMYEIAKENTKNCPNVEILNQDILSIDVSSLPSPLPSPHRGEEFPPQADPPLAEKVRGNYKIVSSLPYQITSPFLRKFLLPHHSSPSERGRIKEGVDLIVLLIQKEVAERLTAKPGSRDRGFMTVFVELLADTQIIQTVSPEAFYPQPEVKSAIILIKPKLSQVEVGPLKSPRSDLHLDNFFKLVHAGFSSKRRKLRNSLSGGLGISTIETEELLKKSEIDPNRRAETLTLEEWLELFTNYK